MTTRDVQPRLATTYLPSTDDSIARVAVVPTAITRPPLSRAPLTTRALVGGTANHSGPGASLASCDDTPVCSVTGASWTPAVTSRVTSRGVNGRPADAISALRVGAEDGLVVRRVPPVEVAVGDRPAVPVELPVQATADRRPP